MRAIGAGIATVAVVVLCPVAGAHDGKLTFAPVLEKATPAVVSIRVDGRRRSPWSSTGPTGSGVIIDADEGHVVTNHHVIRGAEKITVSLKDRRQFEAELVGSDPATDIALLKIEADDLEALPLGDSDALKVGDFVVAIGNPFDLGQTVTSGIVSALGRTGFSRGESYEDFIQTDAAINRGNSGGALVDLDGRLVGINSLIVSPSGTSAGLGFAVPANIVKIVTRQFVDYGGVRRGLLGVAEIENVTPDAARVLGLEAAKGVVVGTVIPGSGAEAAGVEPGDVIVTLDGEDVLGLKDLQTRVGLAEIGDEVELGVVRNGEARTIAATLGSRDRVDTAPVSSTRRFAGAEVRNLSADHPLRDRVNGVEVVAVEPGSRAWDAGIRAGDVILAVNLRVVENLDDLERAVAGQAEVGVLLQRGNQRRFRILR